NQISIGMAQRVAFARCLMQKSPAILLDEPFASLDAFTRNSLQVWLKQKVSETQKYGLIVTHDIREALFLSEEIHVLSHIPAQIIASFYKKHEGSFSSSTQEEFSEVALEKKIFKMLSKNSA
ncbi:MAG: ATP-binding cassette domain-containing protein, partial [Silvanigrellaceae bacterium]|nr:ATP-binding cassette domain-containing protein [Silvanigrellaceae bacterium]